MIYLHTSLWGKFSKFVNSLLYRMNMKMNRVTKKTHPVTTPSDSGLTHIDIKISIKILGYFGFCKYIVTTHT